MSSIGAGEQVGQTDHCSQKDESATRIGASNVDLCREWQKLRAARTFCDVELRGAEAQSPRVPCHRSVLSVHSVYFRTMFLSGMKESKQKVIQLHNIPHAVLSELIDYCYMADLLLTENNVQSLLIAAMFLDIVPVMDACWKFMEDHMHVKNCLMLYCFASSDAHKNSALADKAKELVLRHFMSISQGQDFLEVPKNTVIDLICSDRLWVPREDDVMVAVVRWLQHDFEQRRGHFWQILQNIRQSYLSPQCSDD
ncbi:kelch-like protein diablo [Paramacrobiotus metropolitanus]|uniref:kelch-like protein diablo n=1 Tax=Paramacrobiotus metropolitanus TaxID=2943436 RepID=UPI0024460D28|nr:kelch-like protein diablo [Paramacrobiotus metropolitanus]